jgi:hypothetical protein
LLLIPCLFLFFPSGPMDVQCMPKTEFVKHGKLS